MALRLKPKRPIPDEIRRLTERRLGDALEFLNEVDQTSPSSVEETVFEVRKRCKQVRAIARVVRVPLGEEFSLFTELVRDAAAELGPLRDAHATIRTVEELSLGVEGRREDLDTLLAQQTKLRRNAEKRALIEEASLRRCAELLCLARDRVALWDLPDNPEILAVGIRTTFRKGKRDFRVAKKRPTTKHLHEWRKSVKTLWYETRLIERSVPAVLSPLVEQLDGLGRILGADHDLSVLIERLGGESTRGGSKKRAKRAAKAARKQQKKLRKEAFRVGIPIFGRSTEDFSQEVIQHWLDHAVSEATRRAAQETEADS